jgi:hypothetical protein
MKKLFTVLALALFTIGLSAQEAKPAEKAPVKKEASAKKCSTEEKAKCAKTTKSCCAKKA